jgi:hypothetical protein
MTGDNKPARSLMRRPLINSAHALEPSLSSFELRALSLQTAKKGLIAKHLNSNFSLTPLKHLNLQFSSRNTILHILHSLSGRFRRTFRYSREFRPPPHLAAET